MLSHTPLWIIFTYGGCMFAIASSAVLLYRPQAWARAGGSWPIHWRRHYVLGRNLVCLTGSSLRPRSGPVDTLKASEFAASKRTQVGLRAGNYAATFANFSLQVKRQLSLARYFGRTRLNRYIR
jgi:hypothetical protein